MLYTHESYFAVLLYNSYFKKKMKINQIGIWFMYMHFTFKKYTYMPQYIRCLVMNSDIRYIEFTIWLCLNLKHAYWISLNRKQAFQLDVHDRYVNCWQMGCTRITVCMFIFIALCYIKYTIPIYGCDCTVFIIKHNLEFLKLPVLF